MADEATIKILDKYSDMLGAADRSAEDRPRRRRSSCCRRAKPIYYVISGMHSPETGGPEMLIELAYRLIVEETPFIQNIRNNVITLITPVIEVDGREKQVDTYYFNKKRAQGDARLPLMYWGKYVQHDNNRDGMGQFLKLTAGGDEGRRSSGIRRSSTICTRRRPISTRRPAPGPTTKRLDPITSTNGGCWRENDVMEMTKRGVPGVWTYGFYDGWVPNYMFFIAHSHNSIGRFYEVQSYGPDPYTVTPGATTTSKEWFRPNPPLPSIKWGPRNNTNIQESALLFSLSHVAKNKELYLENYWLKNKRAVDKGKTGPTYAWVIPATQRRKADAAQAVNELRDAGARSVEGAGGVQGRQRRRQGRRLRRPRRSAVPHARRHVFLDPELRAAEPVAVRRHRLDVPVHARPQDPAGHREGDPRSADDAADGGREGAGRHRGHRQRAGRRSHGRQQPRHVPVQERGREDAGGRGRLRAGRPQVPRRRDHRAERRSREARADAEGSRAVGVGGRRRRRASRRTTSTSRASATSTAGRGRRTKAGGARRSTPSACRTPTSPIRSCARATCGRSTTC